MFDYEELGKAKDGKSYLLELATGDIILGKLIPVTPAEFPPEVVEQANARLARARHRKTAAVA
jgi:hypothetical protein